MADLIDRAALKIDTWERLSDAVCDLVEAPAVDAVEVVRCKECEHWTPGKAMGGNSLDDMQIIGRCPLSNFMRREKDFCSFGERRTDATDRC